MNFKNSIIALSFLVAAVAAQEPAPDSDEKIGFSQIRGDAYNSLAGNIAGFNNINKLLLKPSLFAGKNLFYANLGENYKGVVSWGESSMRWILGYSQQKETPDIGMLSFGLGHPAFGVLLNVGLSRTSTGGTEKNGDDKTSTNTVEKGDIIGLNFSMPLGGFLMRASFSYTNDEDNVTTNTYGAGQSESIDKNNIVTIGLGFGNGPSADRFFWEAGLSAKMYGAYEKSPATDNKEEPKDDIAGTKLDPFFNMAYVAMRNDVARITWGFNNSIRALLYKEIKIDDNNTKKHSEFGLLISPNILGEILITDNLIAFGEAVHYFYVNFDTRTTTTINSDPNNGDDTDTESTIASKSPAGDPGTEVAGGLRLQGKHAAIEARLSDTFYENILTKEHFKGALNGFIYF